MTRTSRNIAHFSTALIACGALWSVLGIAAIAWPQASLVLGMILAALLLAVSGLYQVALAFRSRASNRGWPIPLANGLVSIAFAALTLCVPAFPLRVVLLMSATWLASHALLTLGLAFALWPMRRTRLALLGWTGMNALLAFFAVFYPGTTAFTLLQAGAFYAIITGALQAASGIWLRRVALPLFDDTLQARWRTNARVAR